MSNFSFSQCFQKACFLGASKGVIVWEWVKGFVNQNFNFGEYSKMVKNAVEKGDIANY